MSAVRDIRSAVPRSVDGLPPPHDERAEAAVLGAALVLEECLDEVVAGVEPEAFLRPPHQGVALAIRALHEAHSGVDAESVIAWCVADSAFVGRYFGHKCDIPDTVMELVQVVPVSRSVPMLIRRVRDLARLRRGILEAQTFIARAYTGEMGEHGSVQGLLDAHAAEAAEVATDAADAGHADALAVAKELARSMRDRARSTGVPTGFAMLDEYLGGGLRGGAFALVGGRPGMGKTAFSMQIAEHASRNVGVLLCQLEMTREELFARQLSQCARVSIAQIRRAAFSPEEHQRVSASMSRLAQLPIVYADTPGLGLLDIHAHAKRARAAFRRQGIDLGLVVVDHVGLVRPATRRPSREQEVSEVSRGLKWLAKSLDVPVIACAQLSREASKKGSGKVRAPILTDLRESGSLEQDADVVMLVHRAGYYDKAERQDVAEIVLAKQRNGPTGSVNLGCDMRFVHFYEREGDDHAPP